MKKNNTLAQRLLAAPHILWSVLFIVAPLAIVVFYAFTDSSFSFSFSNFSKLFNDGTVEVFTLSLAFAFCATCICLVVAYPLAYFISRTSKKTQNTFSRDREIINQKDTSHTKIDNHNAHDDKNRHPAL